MQLVGQRIKLKGTDDDEHEQELEMPSKNNTMIQQEQQNSQRLTQMGHSFHLDNSFQVHQEQMITNRQELQESQYLQLKLPIKTVLLTIGLTIFGILFMAIGLYDLFIDGNVDTSRILAFLSLGVIMSIPGIYYSIYLYLYYNATSIAEKQQILNEFPLD